MGRDRTSLSQQTRANAHAEFHLRRMPRKRKMHQVPDNDAADVKLQSFRQCHATSDLGVP
jgi:hypothetical protein